MLRFEGVDLHYGSFRALSGVSLHADPGELVVLLGANGAGKTSIFMAASGIRRPSAGRIRLGDGDITGQRPAQIVASGLVHCPEGRKLFPMMTVRKNLTLGAYVHRGDKAGIQRSLDEVFSLFPILAAKQNDPAGSLSGGQQQMVAIGRAMLGRPRVLLLDEPSLGLAPLLVRSIFETVRAINKRGVTVLLVEQNARAALKLATRGYVLEVGSVVMEDKAENLLANASVREAYLGG